MIARNSDRDRVHGTEPRGGPRRPLTTWRGLAPVVFPLPMVFTVIFPRPSPAFSWSLSFKCTKVRPTCFTSLVEAVTPKRHSKSTNSVAMSVVIFGGLARSGTELDKLSLSKCSDVPEISGLSRT